jgi:hypothetical protein
MKKVGQSQPPEKAMEKFNKSLFIIQLICLILAILSFFLMQ